MPNPDLEMPWFQQWKHIVGVHGVGKNLTVYQLHEFAPIFHLVPGSADLWWLTKYLLSKDLLSILQTTWLHIIYWAIFFFLFLSEPRLPSILKYISNHYRNVKYLFSCKCEHISGNFWFHSIGPRFENNFLNILKNVFFIFMTLLYLLLWDFHNLVFTNSFFNYIHFILLALFSFIRFFMPNIFT